MAKFLPIVENGTPQEIVREVKKVKLFINTPVFIYEQVQDCDENNICKIETFSHSGNNPMAEAAMSTKYPEVIDILKDNGSDYIYLPYSLINEGFYATYAELAAAYNPNPEILRKFLTYKKCSEFQFDKNPFVHLNNIGQDLYRDAVSHNKNPKVLQEVFDMCGKDTFSADINGTPIPWMLYFAIHSNEWDGLEIGKEKLRITLNAVKKYNIDVNAKGSNGHTAGDSLKNSKKKIHPEMQKILDEYNIKLKTTGYKPSKPQVIPQQTKESSSKENTPKPPKSSEPHTRKVLKRYTF